MGLLVGKLDSGERVIVGAHVGGTVADGRISEGDGIGAALVGDCIGIIAGGMGSDDRVTEPLPATSLAAGTAAGTVRIPLIRPMLAAGSLRKG